ncbi:hypothetical protein [Chryseobacterium sp. EO14]|uniref:hypothetical protein n=1 Tax=Chryseobacterium sp. EO14 TaxID=2950551 RepID=UPI0021094144|nr:hypothetical protein [Chryseobacterium sp. EO14]MCQ4139143.1 hypothetical protein [Chryseobacterium sp. EO14]
MFHNLFKNWNFVRLLRLAMGIFLTIEAVKSGMWFLIITGVIFTVMPLLNIGCCSGGSCSVSVKNMEQTHDEVDYEEIKSS